MNIVLLMFMPLVWASNPDTVDPRYTIDTPDVGNWTVGDCILLQFSMELTFDPRNHTDLNRTVSIEVPPSAVVVKSQSHCGTKDQTIVLSWEDRSSNGTDLGRNLTIQFSKQNNTEKVSAYGVKRMYGRFELGQFLTKDGKNKTFNASSFITIDSGDRPLDKLMFKVPLNRSYFCHDIGNKAELETILNYRLPNPPPQGYQLPNVTLVARNVAFDAFRPATATKHVYQIPMDCDYEPNDVVPIVVGIALAALVVLVLIAYIIGRHRRRQQGYLSV